jgi:hypothetical protein
LTDADFGTIVRIWHVFYDSGVFAHVGEDVLFTTNTS